MDTAAPATLNDGILSGPLWLQGWVMLLVVANLGALFFVLQRRDGKLALRAVPVAILASFFAAAAFMDWLFSQVGYVRLLGLAHLVCWGPVYAWVLSKRAEIGRASGYGKYVHFYLLIAGISLVIDVIDVIDVIRYLVGDGTL